MDRKRLIAIIFVFVAAIAVYTNTLGNDLVRDDKFFVLENRWITDIGNIPEIVSSPVWGIDEEGASNQYRPLYHLFFMVGYNISGKAAWGYHAMNIFVHALSTVFVYLFTASLLVGRRKEEERAAISSDELPLSLPAPLLLFVPFFSALIFAVHPVNTEAVGWVSAISELSFALFYLISLFLYSGARSMKGLRYIGALFFFFLAALSKETTATLPVLLIALEIFVWRRSVLGTIKRLIPFGLVGAVYLFIRFSVLSSMAPGRPKHVAHLTDLELLKSVPSLFADYLGKLFLPVELNFDYVFEPVMSLSEPRFILPVIICLLFIVALVRLWRYDRLVFFALLWIAVPLLPALYIPALGRNTFTERYLYLSTGGFGFLLALYGAKLSIYFSQRSGQSDVKGSFGWMRAFGGALAVLVVLYAGGTVMRNFTWKDNYTLWGDTVAKSPESRIARNNLGLELVRRGDLDASLTHFIEARRIDPLSALAYNNIGVVYARKGLMREAAKEFATALRLDPTFTDAANNLRQARAALEGAR